MLDSLVRVSRRAVGNHFVSITLTLSHLQESLIITQNIACNKSHHYKWQANLIGCQATSIDSTTGNQCYNNGRSQIPSLKPSLAKPIHADLPRNTGTPKQHQFHTLSFQQFQVLFNSLFKVLFIFPSQYLFAIGLSPLFSFGWNLPPIRTAVSSNPTRWMRTVCKNTKPQYGTITLHGS